MAVHRFSSLPSVSAFSSVTASYLSQVDSAAVGLGCCQAHCDLCGRCFKRRGFGRHRCSGACPHPTVQARQQFQHVYLCSMRFRRSQDLVLHQASCSLSLQFPFGDHVTFVAVVQQDRTGQVCECVCVCMRERVRVREK